MIGIFNFTQRNATQRNATQRNATQRNARRLLCIVAMFFQLTLSAQPPNDKCINAFAIANLNEFCTDGTNSSLLGATNEQEYSYPYDCDQGQPVKDVWYKFTTPSTMLTLNLNGMLSPIVELYNGSSCTSLEYVMCQQNTVTNQIYTTLPLTSPIDTYYIRVYSNAAGTNFHLCTRTASSAWTKGLETERLTVETSYGVDNRFFDIWDGVEVNSATSYPLGSSVHAHLADALAAVGVTSYYQHVHTTGNTRYPFCEKDLFNTNELLSDTENGYFNLDFLNQSDNACIEQTPGDAFLRPMVSNAHSNGQTIGLYIYAPVDFTYEISHSTEMPTNAGIQPSIALCRRKDQFEIFTSDLYPGGAIEDISGPQPLLVEPALGNCLDDFDGVCDVPPSSNTPVADTSWTIIDTLANGSIVSHTYQNGKLYHYHNLCFNDTTWRHQFENRLAIMGDNHADFILFDRTHNPTPTSKSGCWCIGCRQKFVTSIPPSFDGITFQASDFDEANFLNGAIQQYEPPNKELIRDHLMADFTNSYMTEHFTTFEDIMAQRGMVGIVSVGDLASLNRDEYRTDFAAVVGMPKTEFLTAIKKSNNDLFWGDNHTLNKWLIPEDIRLATGIGILRDASRHGLPYTWLPYKWRMNTLGVNNSVRNNQSIRTLLGFGYALGTVTSISLRPFFTVDSTDNIQIKNLTTWDYTNLTGAPMVTGYVNPLHSQIVPVFSSAATTSELFSGMRAYNYVAIHFNENEQQSYLYRPSNGLPTGYQADFNTYLNPALVANNLAPLSYTNGSLDNSERRETLFWFNQGLPLHGAVNALMNYMQINGTDTTTYKMPVSYITSKQITMAQCGSFQNQQHQLYRAIIEPMPLDGALNQPMPTNQFAPLPVVEVSANVNWFRRDTDQQYIPQHRDLLTQTRNHIIAAAGLPDAFVTGHSAVAHTVLAGFFVPETENYSGTNAVSSTKTMVIPLVIQPMSGIPRTDFSESNSDGTPLLNTELNLEYDSAYIDPNLLVPAGDLKLHLLSDGQFLPFNVNATYQVGPLYELDSVGQAILNTLYYNTMPCVDIQITYSDGTSEPLNITAQNIPEGTHLIDIPKFTQFAIIKITNHCEY